MSKMTELTAVALAAAYNQTLCREHLSDNAEALLRAHIRMNGAGIELNDEIVVFLLHQMRIGGAGVSVVGPRGSVLVHSQCTATELARYHTYERDHRQSPPRRRQPFRFSPFTAFRAESFFALRASALSFNGRLDGDQRDVHRVFVPINGDGHWSLLVIDCRQQELRHYDSIRVNGVALHVNYVQRILDMLLAAELLQAPWPIVDQYDMPDQQDAYSCGFAVVGAAAAEHNYVLARRADPLQLVVTPDWMREVCFAALDQSAAGKHSTDYEKSRLRNYFRVVNGNLADACISTTGPAPNLAMMF